MSCGNNNSTYSNTCCPDVPYPTISAESVPSLIGNLVYALYGTINKTIINGRVVWDIPCDPDNTTEVEQIPREEGEGLLCYLLRLFAQSLDSYGQFLRWGFTGSGQSAFTLTGAYQPDRNAYLAYIDGVVQDPINYTISSTLPRVLTLSAPLPSGSNLTIVELAATAGATGATGPTGPQGTPGGATGATGLPSPAGGIRWAYPSDGSNTLFALPGAFTTLNTAYLVTFDGVTQDPNNYTIAAGSPYSITLSTSPAVGVGIVIVSLNGIEGATGPQGTPGGATGATGIGATGATGIGATGAGSTGATGPVGPSFPSGGLRWAYTGDGLQTIFNISGALTTLATAYLVTIDGITQDSANYTITAGSPYKLTISTVPNGSFIVITSLTAGLANWITGFGSPNNVVTAQTGSIYTNLNGGSLSTLYVKESGAGNTGWIAK